MIAIQPITDLSHPSLDALFALYIESFPEEERRDIDQLKRFVADKQQMQLCTIEYEGEFAGLFIYWDMGEFYYLEHFAVDPAKRNQQIGRQALDYFRENLSKPHVLEVELPNDEMSRRRISYYERNGYQVLEQSYRQPSYRHSCDEEYPMWIMGSPEAKNKIQEYIETIKKEVYGK